MPSPEEVIKNIRERKFGKDLDTENLPRNIREHIEEFKKFREEASRLAANIHTHSPHFIFELIQNAEDNEYVSTEEAKIKFIIRERELIIQNNEKGFQEENVRALCGIGGSTKKNALGYIGEKGIGFKSVFMISDEPHIYSNGFRFEFIHNPEEPESIIIPHWVNTIHHLNVDPTQTNIVLPLKPKAKSEIKQYIDQIHPSLLLFLRKLKIIEIEDNIQHTHEKIKRYDHNGQIEIEHGEKKSYWRTIKKTLEEIPEHINEDRLRDIHDSEIEFHETDLILAFPLNEDGSADASNEQDVFAFLPVRGYGFKFIIQADFLLPVSREDILKDNEWNKWLRDHIFLPFLDAINEFKVDKKLRYTFYNYLPLKEEVKDDFFLPVVEQIYEKLKNIECILTETNQWKKPLEVLIGDKEIRKLVSNEDLKNFFDKEYLSTEIKAKKPILRLGVEEFSIDNLIKCLENTEWVKKQDDDWFAFLYEYLSKQKLSDAQLKQLKGLDIIRLENEELTSIKEGAIFLPLDKKGKGYGFENELRIIKGNIIDIISGRERQEKDLKILEFLKKLDIQPSDPYEIIENHILPIYSIYKNDEWKRKDSATLLGYVKYIKENIKAYGKKGYGLWRLPILVNKSAEGKRGYEGPEDIYLPKIYGNENDLETLFEGIDVNFVHPCYIEDVLNESTESEQQRDDKIEEWRDFFSELEVNTSLIVKKDPKTLTNDEPYYADDEVTKKKILKREKEETVWKDCNWEDTDWRGYYIQNDWISKDFDRIIEKLEKRNEDAKSDICKQLAGIIDANWENFKKHKSCKYYYRYFNQVGWSSAETPSTFLLTLKKEGWLPTTQNTIVKPSQIFLNKPEIQEVLGDTVLYLAVEIKNEDFIKTLGINTEASVKNVLNYLKALVEQGCDDKSKFNKLYEFLNRHSDEDRGSIKPTLSANPLIYIPDASKKFFTIHDVLWKVSDIFGGNRGYLEGHYPDLKDFFVDKLGVSEKPLPKDYADVLVDLSQKEKITSKDEQIILKIYEKLNYHLNPDNVEENISEEDWWNEFIRGRIFFTENKGFLCNDGDIFINDNQERYNLFKDDKSIAFLLLPQDYHPEKIKFFIASTGLGYLSKTVRIIPNFDEFSCTKHETLTKRVKKSLPYILRYLYWEEYTEYESLREKGLFEKITNLEVYYVDKVQVKYVIQIHEDKSISTTDTQPCLLHENKLYIAEGFANNMDYVAIELSKKFGEIKGLDDFIISIFEKQTEDKIENLMSAKGIRKLPPEEISIPSTGKVTEIPSTQKSISSSTSPEELEESTDQQKKWTPEYDIEDVDIKVEDYKPKGAFPSLIGEEDKKVRNSSHSGTKPSTTSSLKPERPDSGPDKIAIGREGEKYALKTLKDEKVEKYPDAKVIDNDYGFIVEREEEIIAHVRWLNKHGESGSHCDIEITENGKKEYIEVKSTETEERDWFDMGKDQWELMQKEGDSFWIYRVYGVGTTKKPKLTKIRNPAKHWREGDIVAHPIRVQI